MSNIGFDIIYYDAFGPNSQEEMWELNQFSKLFDLTNKNGRLVTYCAKGQVRRDLQKAGYIIERLEDNTSDGFRYFHFRKGVELNFEIENVTDM